MVDQFEKDYVSVTYNEERLPFTDYPNLLSKYIVDKYKMSKGKKILDLGCGRGEFLKGFSNCGLKAYGLDQSMVGKEINSDVEILQLDMENDIFPYDDDMFDFIFTKSVLEHFYYPERLVSQVYRILKPGGMIVIMVPDWEDVYKTFYVDYTHRTPFMKSSLRDILILNNFKNVNVDKFIQLPFLWYHPWFLLVSKFVKFLAPSFLRKHSKLVRFSKEGMLLASAVKI